MNRTSPHIPKNLKKHLLVFASVLLVLISSCAVKTGIKNLAGLPSNAERGLPQGSHDYLSVNFEQCTNSDSSDTEIVQKISVNAKALLPVLVLTAAFIFILSLRAAVRENKHPLYSRSAKIRNSIPIFLEYRKLIIYYSC